MPPRRSGDQEISPRREFDETGEIAIGSSSDRRPVVIADLHVKASRGALRNPAPDFSETENTQTLACNGWGLDTPLILPSTGTDEAIGLKQVPGCCHQQHHRGVGDSGCVRVGAIGNHDTPTPGGVQIDCFIARANGANDLELWKQGHLIAAQTAAAVGQHGPDSIGCLANSVCPVCIFFPLVDDIPGSRQRGHAFRSDSHQSQDTDSHDCSFETKTDQDNSLPAWHHDNNSLRDTCVKRVLYVCTSFSKGAFGEANVP